MFRTVLIANRGEIALRIVRACRDLGLRAVVAHSQADADSWPARAADAAICIGPPEASRSYLNAAALLSAAEVVGADALHPGYGFLAESAELADACAAAGVTFIGPSAESLRLLGDKLRARELAARAGVPVLPGCALPGPDPAGAARAAAQVGYPLMLKASAGGGGRGMRLVPDEAGLRAVLGGAQAEAAAAFGDATLYLERYLESPRHVEVQVAADAAGRVIHLGERDCSLQRRHQKLLEEAPAPGVTPDLRAALGEAAVRVAAAAGYRTLGTAEFLLDGAGRFYFIEMNARIQVEHPVTELVAGLDLVVEQIGLAAGHPLSQAGSLERPIGHALECRINAEHPETFAPSPGLVTRLAVPGGPGIRWDSHVYAGYAIPPHYDSLVGKLIAHGRAREEARRRMLRALGELRLDGIGTSVPLHQRILADPDFVAGRVSTGLLARILERGRV
jgi:acetyl-CoA carboxylase biotin carboxylase subunit